MTNRDFLKGVLRGDKILLPLQDVSKLSVPKYDELAVRNLEGHMKQDAVFMMYFPDSLPKGRHFDRTYFFQILHHLHPQYTRDIISHATR